MIKMSTVKFPVAYIPDPDKGRPLFNGQMYIGISDLDPQIVENQKQVYFIEENGDLVDAKQPIILSAGGVPVYNGSPVTLDVDGSYSLKVLDKQGAQIYYIANTDELTGVSSKAVKQTVQGVAGQTTVVFSKVLVVSASIYIGSKDVDRGRLIEGVDYNVTGSVTIELTDSFPAGTYFTAIATEATETNTVEFVKNYIDLLGPINDAGLKLNDTVNIKDTSISSSGGGTWDAVLSTSVTVNPLNIRQCIGAPTLALVQRPLTETYTPLIWYVDPLVGSDVYGQGVTAGSGAFKTIQFAYDSLPVSVIHQQTLQLADGTYNSNYLASGDMIRPSVLFAKSKFISARTQKKGNDLIGGIIIKGNATTPANVIIEPNDTYSYGIYNAQGQLGLQDFHIVTALGSTNINFLLTSHRMDSYVHTVNVTCDGRDKAVTSRGILTESGGQIEFTTTTTQTDIKNCSLLVSTITSGDNITISGQYTLDTADVGAQAEANSVIKFVASGLTGQEIKNCSSKAVYVADNGFISFRGNSDGSHMLIDGDVDIINGAAMECIWADITGVTTLIQSTLTLNNSDYQNQITSNGSDIFFTNSDSFISPATANTNAIPVLLKDGSDIHEEGTNNFNGSTGQSLSARDVFEQSVSVDGETISIPEELNAMVRLNAGVDRASCVLPAGRYQWQTVEIFSFSGFFVEIVNSTTAIIATGAIRVSGATAADEYQGIKLVWRDSKWYEISRSLAGIA